MHSIEESVIRYHRDENLHALNIGETATIRNNYVVVSDARLLVRAVVITWRRSIA